MEVIVAEAGALSETWHCSFFLSNPFLRSILQTYVVMVCCTDACHGMPLVILSLPDLTGYTAVLEVLYV